MAVILDSLVGSCVKKLQAIITKEAILILGVKDDLTELQRTMNQIKSLLIDAEKRRIEEHAVNDWLGEFRDAMYDADDIIDLASYEGSNLLEGQPSSSSSRKSIACARLSFFSCLPNVLRRHEIAIRIMDFNTKLAKISWRGDQVLKLQSMQSKAEVPAPKQMKTCSLVEPNLVGEETSLACTRLVELVLAHKEKKAYKLGIVGTGGVGKTTLARKIYNDHRIKGTFSKQAWICVSQEYSEVDLLKEILRYFGVDQVQGETVGELRSKLSATVEEMSFFLVLDDIWQPEVWTNLLRTPLHAAANGIIVLTTRHDRVAHAIGDHVHRVELMSSEVGWELLWKTLNINEEKEVKNLRDIGMEIVRKCGGLPLAIRVIASVLATKEKTESQWRKVINKSAWSMSKLPPELRGALYLSYDELPWYLKQCFLYWALFPENCMMNRDDLIRFWVAEGFVEEQEEQLLEDTAEDYYYELINRNILQPDPGYFDHEWCQMHDLLRQLAQHLSAEECFCGDSKSLETKSLSKLRRVSIAADKDSVMLRNVDNEQIRARTLIIHCGKQPSVENTIFKVLTRIRVLDLTDSIIQSVPDCIRSLIHLRSLDLDGTDISYLPESLGSLKNLQILNLGRCNALQSLPLAITKLCSLRRLGLRGTPINEVPKGIGRLEFLNDLEGFAIGGDSNDSTRMQDGWNLDELAPLLQLRHLHMIKLERATPCSTDSLLIDKKHLKVLYLWCTERTDEPYYSEEDVSNIEKIFEQLSPPHNLEDLVIESFFGRRYPTWLSTTHLSSVKYLKLIDCKSCVCLPPIGKLPNLKYLRINRATAVTKIGPEFIGYRVGNLGSREAVAFPKLETLVIKDMPNWEEWSFVEEQEVASPRLQLLPLLPRLNKLQLDGCPKLRALPRQLGKEATSLRELQLRGASCLKVVEDLPLLCDVLVIVGCEGLERASNLPQAREQHVDFLVGSCAKKLQDIIADEAFLILGVKEELRELQRTMSQIQCFLNDSEQRRTEEQAVNNWFGELRDAMYDVDDIIDLAMFEGSKLLENHPSSSRNSTAYSGISLLSCFPNIKRRHEIAVQIRNLNTRIEKISKLSGSFLARSDAAPVGESSASKLRNSSHLVEPNLVGKEIKHSSRKLVDLVLAHKENKAYKLAIVGTGGVGKTTLAQKIYNDQRIEGNFKNHAWICVSQEYKEVTLLKEVLRNIGVHQEQGETIAELQGKLAETIEDSSFFLVLDDVWQVNVWTDLLRIPLHAAAAAVILVTTRDDTIAMKIGVEHTHRVDLMSVDVGWELLWKSMNINEEKEVQNLKNIGIEIVRRCGCLPLAIKVTASVLASKDQTENEWKKILNKINAWSRSKLPNEIEGALYLSYDELPRHLKQCFLYCAMYPEDSRIHRDDLVRLWVAEGFVEEQQGQLLEDTAEEYYYELIHRNLLQPDGRYFDHSDCKMHDLVRQLACYLSREECYIGDPEALGGKSMYKLRHISVVTEKDTLVLPSTDKKELEVRTLRALYCKSLGVDHLVFKKLPLLRVLDLTGSFIQSIPGCIECLIHLRLLDLDGTDISCLPESIGSLENLQILNLQRCEALHSLPSAITKLCNLRCLGLDGTPINQVPKGIGKLKFLNDLGGFPIGGGSDNAETQDGWMLEELGHLSQLRRLDMIKLERAIPCSTYSLLIDKKHLKLLHLKCSELIDEPYYSEEDVCNIEKIFEQLSPPQNLEDLVIGSFFGRRYPTWLDTTHLSSVKYLNLTYCESCVYLPPIGQLPNLKYLRIAGATAVTKIGPEFVGCRVGNLGSTEAVAFPKLEWLVIRDMPNWVEWSFVEEEEEAASPRLQLLPRLITLHIKGCPKLRALPQQLGKEATSLRELLIAGCEGLERVSNLPQVRELRVTHCPDLRCVEGLDSLQQLWLDEDMQEISSLWVSGLKQQCQQLHGEDLDVYT